MKRPLKTLIKISIIVSATLLSYHLFALPEGGNVVAGSATINQPNAQTLLINQSSDKAIINWNQFNIGVNELTQFIVPQASSVTLNRVMGGNPSEILGALQSNGQLWLINPNGVIFGPNSQVNVAGLIASTLNIQNEDFMKGNYQLQGNGNLNAKIINQGNIVAGDNGLIALLAPQVENQGILAANLGSVAIGTGNRATLNIAGNQLLNFSVDQGTAGDFYDTQGQRIASVKNSGQIIANGGTVLITAKNIDRVLNQSINTSGLIEANTMSSRNGKIVLSGAGDTMVTGNAVINAKGVNAGERGGDIHILGKRVALTDQAQVNASGAAGGGTVLVGGDYKGANPNIQNSQATYVGRNVNVAANATTQGDGGKVIVWADGATQFYGNIQAQGGPLGGNGGFVETSGKQFLDIAGGRVNVFAPFGEIGTWLLDPYNVTITNSATSGGAFAPDGGAEVFTPTGDDSIVDVADILANLNTANVTITTGSGGSQAGNIVVQAVIPFSGATSRTLTLDAAGAIIIQSAITDAAGDGALSLVLNSAATTGTGISLESDISLEGALAMTTANANIEQLSGSPSTLTIAGNTTFNAGSGIVNLERNNDFQGIVTTTATNLIINDSDGLNLGTSTLTGGITAVSGGVLTISGAVSTNATSSFTGNSITINNAASLTQTSSNLTLNALNGGISSSGSGFINTASVDSLSLSAAGSGNNISLSNSNNNFNTVSATGGAITLVDTDGMMISSLTASGNVALVVNAGGNNDASFSFFGDQLNAGANTVSITNLSTGVNPDNRSAIAFEAGTLTADALNLTSNSSSINDATDFNANVSGTTSINASGLLNNVTLDNSTNNFGTLVITNANNVTLVDTNALTLEASTLTGYLDANVGGALTQSGAVSTGGNITLQGTSIANNALLTQSAGALNLTATNGNITQSGGHIVTAGDTTLSASGTGNDITLNNSSNNFATINAISNARNLTIVDTDGLTLAVDISTSGNISITVNAGGTSVPGQEVLAINNLLSANSGAGNITLINSATDLAADAITYGAAISAADLTLTSQSGAIAVQGSGSLTSTGTATITANDVAGNDANDILITGDNNFNNLSIVNGDSITINDVNGLTLTGITAATGETIIRTNTTASNTGTFTISGSIGAGTNTVNLYNDSTAINSASNAFVLSSGTLTAGDLNVTAESGAIAQSGGAIASSGIASFSAAQPANISLAQNGNDFTDVSVNGNTVTLRDINGLSISGTVQNGLTAIANTTASNTGTLFIGSLDAGTSTVNLTNSSTAFNTGESAIFQNASGIITAGDVNLTALSGEIIQDSGAGIVSSGTTTISASPTTGFIAFTRDNDFNNLVATGATMSFNDIAGGINIGDGGATGINANGDVNITAIGGDITQTSPIVISDTGTFSSSGNVSLTNANNELNTISAIGSSISITEKDDLAIGGTDGIVTLGDVTLLVEGGTLTFNNGAQPITLAGAGTQNVILVADQFVNNFAGGSNPINVGTGLNSRWVFYLTNLSGNTFGSGANALTSSNQAIWGTSYPTAVSASGNRYVFATPQTLAITPLATPFTVNKTYGATATLPTPTAAGGSPNYQVSGFVNASDYDNVFTQDTASNVAISGLSYASLGSTSTADVTSSPYAIMMAGTGATTTGYGVGYADSTYGNVVVAQAPLTITANNTSRAVNTPNPTFTVTYTGLQNDDTSSVVSGLTVTSPATLSSPAGTYAIIPADGTAVNYTISYVNGVLTVIGSSTPSNVTLPNNNPQVNPSINADILNDFTNTITEKPAPSDHLTDEVNNDPSEKPGPSLLNFSN